jgi:hypothetical protein
MYARVITLQVEPGAQDIQASFDRSTLDSATARLPGFNGSLLLTDPTTGKTLSITLWDSETDELSSEASRFVQCQLASLGGALAAPAQREQYAVRYQA